VSFNTLNKRRREQEQAEKQRQKKERREQRKLEKATRVVAPVDGDVDPDIAHIKAGPQPIPTDE
jgi:hypothetical protein